jgi:hypothetical protein
MVHRGDQLEAEPLGVSRVGRYIRVRVGVEAQSELHLKDDSR